VTASFTWYLARAGGLLAFGLLTLSVLAGLTLSGRARLKGWPRFAIEDIHRFLGLLTGVFIALHVGALLLDGYLPFSVVSVLVPGTAPYRPVASAVGVVAMELLLALAITNRYRKRLSYWTWRRLHYLNFAVWVLALVHGIAAGTDTRDFWALSAFAVAAGAVAGATAWRVLAGRVGLLWPVTAAVVSAELIVALALGPLGHPA
jgi:sulfoxide reductase heme-binding subunit YedZ